MNASIALQMTSDLLKMALVVLSPLLAVILVSGLMISVLQVATQIQDPALAFTSKLATFLVALIVLSPWIAERVIAYANSLFSRIPLLV